MEPISILNAIEWLEMDPHGVFTGVVGAILSLFVVNGNSFSWQKILLILVAGVGICGYSLPAIESKIISDEGNRSIALLANIIVGFTSSDILSSIKTAAPTLTNFFVEKGISFGKRIFTSNNTKNDK